MLWIKTAICSHTSATVAGWGRSLPYGSFGGPLGGLTCRGGRAIPADFVKMTVDKPFVFALRDAASGLVLLTGYVDNPKVGGS
jgi:hypothetical protein